RLSLLRFLPGAPQLCQLGQQFLRARLLGALAALAPFRGGHLSGLGQIVLQRFEHFRDERIARRGRQTATPLELHCAARKSRSDVRLSELVRGLSNPVRSARRRFAVLLRGAAHVALERLHLRLKLALALRECFSLLPIERAEAPRARVRPGARQCRVQLRFTALLLFEKLLRALRQTLELTGHSLAPTLLDLLEGLAEAAARLFSGTRRAFAARGALHVLQRFLHLVQCLPGRAITTARAGPASFALLAGLLLLASQLLESAAEVFGFPAELLL